ncbi:hypothetical protein BC832DRAFT_591033 [Gaertneriomyces semiglobifer]|nr:hypothetical protein BC832DRAFT_591033 [Gaertneriomyces semiglobifer]
MSSPLESLLSVPVVCSPKLSLFHYLCITFLEVDLVFRLTVLSKATYSDRRNTKNGELWWFYHSVQQTYELPTRGMRPTERRKDWRKYCMNRYAVHKLAPELPVPVVLNRSKEVREYVPQTMEASEVMDGARGKLSAEEKAVARAWYKEQKNKKIRGKGPVKCHTKHEHAWI